MNAPMTFARQFNAAEMLAEVQREIGCRRKMYPNLIKRKKLQPDAASLQIAIMESVALLLDALSKTEAA